VKQFFLASNACGRTAAAVSRRIQSYLALNGMAQTAQVAEADLVVPAPARHGGRQRGAAGDRDGLLPRVLAVLTRS